MVGDTIDQIMDDSTEVETKVDVEEVSVNLNCVKNELAEEVVKFDENLRVTQYRVNLKNIFEVVLCKNLLEESDDNLIGFLDNEAIMENVVIKFEGIKEEDGNFDYCNKCNGDYKGFCLKCSTLSHILNNASPPTSPESEINTVPKGILEIRDFSVETGVFVLTTLPKNIIFGPFEGISAVRNANGDSWKINKKRLENAESGNWMKDIACASSALIKNLDIFQMEGDLYFKTNREIMEGEELLVYYDNEEVKKIDDGPECYFIPQKQENLPKIFACTLCSLGFQLFKCLMEHKSKCPHAERNTNIKDFEVIECHYCNIWLEKQEYQAYHLDTCSVRYLKMSYSHSERVDRNQVKVEDGNTKAVHGRFKCSQCSYATKYEKRLQRHLHIHKKSFRCDICMMNYTSKAGLKMHIKSKHTENNLFKCGICKMEYTQRGSLNMHIKNKHTETAKDYQCSECSFQTNYKQKFKSHLNRHRGIKPFECGICKMKFTLNVGLKKHIKNKHTESGCAKDYQCSECTYQTNVRHYYQTHLNRHRGIKPFECGICKTKFTQAPSLKKHIKNKHTESGSAKDYQCCECTFQTNYKNAYQHHLNRHRGIKAFECGICKMKFTEKKSLNMHMKYKHTEDGCAKDYQCSECTYETHNKRDYQNHLNRHRGIKPFECDICKAKFTLQGSLKVHIKNKHSENGCAKDYQCPECTFQTIYKHVYESHLNGHRGIKAFECGVCQMKFTHKCSLKKHIKNKHAESGCAQNYQCSECSYQTNYKRDYQTHLSRHRGVPIECGICKTKFTRKESLKLHLKNIHKIDVR